MIVLMCVHPFGKYTKGQMVTDKTEIDVLQMDRDHHFVRLDDGLPEPEPVAAVQDHASRATPSEGK